MNIRDFRNSYSGRVFLIGSGPSLKKTPLELLQDEYTFATNSVPDIFSETEWRPSFYACVDKGVDIEYCKEAIGLGIPCFFPKNTLFSQLLTKSIPVQNNMLFFESVDLRDRDELGINTLYVDFDSIYCSDVWSKDITEVVYGYNTVMYHMMQISVYMGFDEIYLIGNDLYDTFDEYLIFPEELDPGMFPRKHQSKIKNGVEFLCASENLSKSLCNLLLYEISRSGTFNRVYPHMSRFTNVVDQTNYFSDDYSDQRIITPEKNQRHILAHKLAKSVSNELEFDIYNATMGGNLEVYQRVDLKTIIGA